MTQAQQQRVAESAAKQLEQLQRQTLQVALEAAEKGEVPTFGEVLRATDQEVNKRNENGGNGGAVGNGGVPTPAGRPKGVRNKLTNLRDAVLEAFDTVGGAQYLVQLAKGTQSDRAAFTSLVAKVLPTQINQQVEGGIRLELTWLGGRQIGATQAQIESQHTQALDLERDSDGRYRIKDQQHAGEGGDTPAQGDGQGDQPTAQNGPGGASGA